MRTISKKIEKRKAMNRLRILLIHEHFVLRLNSMTKKNMNEYDRLVPGAKYRIAQAAKELEKRHSALRLKTLLTPDSIVITKTIKLEGAIDSIPLNITVSEDGVKFDEQDS